MDKNKENSAVEKTENIAEQTSSARAASTATEERSGVKRTKTGVSASDAKFKREQLRLQRDAERERIAAERAALKARLKKESEEDRRARIAEENRQRIQLRKEKQQAKERLAEKKREDRKLIKQEKMRRRAETGRDRRSRGVGGWLAAVIALGCTTLVLGAILTFNLLFTSGGSDLLAALYERAFYDLASYADEIDVDLGKLSVASTSAKQQEILGDITVKSELAENQLQTLPLEDESRYATGKYMNQLGDYSRSLSKKIAGGGFVTDEDRATLEEFRRRNDNFRRTLASAKEDMGEKFSFLSLLKPETDNPVVTRMAELENQSAEYPKMIYDGPFSDGLETAEIKGLTGSEITAEAALEKFNAIFADYALTAAEVVNEGDGRIETYNIEAKSEAGYSVYAQMAKRGGTLVTFNCYDPCSVEKFTLDECREIAEVFVKKAGFDNMTPVWETSSRAVASFNFAYLESGVIVYSDLIKVTVCMERGVVSALESTTYCLNHTERDIPSAFITAKRAREIAGKTIETESVRKAMVPVGTMGEALSYEVYGKKDGDAYFIYIDAATGAEIEIFRVIDTAEGELVI